jgi:hypothetical protein
MSQKTDAPALYHRYRIRLEFVSRLEGGVPANKDMIRNWIKARMARAGRDIRDEELEAMVAEKVRQLPRLALEETTEEVVQDSLLYNTFLRGPDGNPVFEGRCVKAAFKEEANILKEILGREAKAEGRGQKTKRDGSEAGSSYNTMFRNKVAERMFVEENLIPFMLGGKTLDDVDGREEKAIHVMTMQGPRSALKRYDYIESGVTLEFTVRLLNDGVVVEHDLLRMLEYGQDNGMGSGRSQGNGRYKVLEIEELEPITATKLFVIRRPAKREVA